jgi:thiosulfate/3-mercaptopyruvate sulfurtransferase
MTSPLVSCADLAVSLSGAEPPVLLDVRWRIGGPPGREEYGRGHLPGAVYLDVDTDLAAPPGPDGRHPLPAAADLQRVLRVAGVREGVPVVTYDAGNGSIASRVWWLLRWAGHDQVRVLDGGLAAWAADSHPVTTEVPSPAEGDVTVRPGHMPVVDADGAATLARTGVLLDARAPERYRGDVEPLDPKAGHIPGARNAPFSTHTGENGRWRSPAELANHFAEVGVGGTPTAAPATTPTGADVEHAPAGSADRQEPSDSRDGSSTDGTGSSDRSETGGDAVGGGAGAGGGTAAGSGTAGGGTVVGGAGPGGVPRRDAETDGRVAVGSAGPGDAAGGGAGGAGLGGAVGGGAGDAVGRGAGGAGPGGPAGGGAAGEGAGGGAGGAGSGGPAGGAWVDGCVAVGGGGAGGASGGGASGGSASGAVGTGLGGAAGAGAGSAGVDGRVSVGSGGAGGATGDGASGAGAGGAGSGGAAGGGGVDGRVAVGGASFVVGAYCGSGVTATSVLLALEVAGLAGPRAPAVLYAGSWSNWSADADRPVVTGGEPG